MTLSPKQGARNLASLAGSFKFLAKFLPYKEGEGGLPTGIVRLLSSFLYRHFHVKNLIVLGFGKRK